MKGVMLSNITRRRPGQLRRRAAVMEGALVSLERASGDVVALFVLHCYLSQSFSLRQQLVAVNDDSGNGIG